MKSISARVALAGATMPVALATHAPAGGNVKLDWTDDTPEAAGYYWYRHPATHEQPALVRVEAVEGELKAYFTGMSVYAPMRMLAGGRWAGPIGRPQ